MRVQCLGRDSGEPFALAGDQRDRSLGTAPGEVMARVLYLLVGIGAVVGCAHTSAPESSAPNQCYVESGWLDATNGCSARAGYPDCYEVCPKAGTRERL
jgi:hypothetical protein